MHKTKLFRFPQYLIALCAAAMVLNDIYVHSTYSDEHRWVRNLCQLSGKNAPLVESLATHGLWEKEGNSAALNCNF